MPGIPATARLTLPAAFVLRAGFEDVTSPLQYWLTVAGGVSLALMACALGWLAYSRCECLGGG